MRHLIAAVVPLLVACATAAPSAETAPDPAAIEQGMRQMSTTGAEHAALKRSVGEWTVATRMWMDPGAEPIAGKGTATVSEMLGGKWLRQDYHGDMMGTPFDGQLISGYDTIAKRYVAVWVDSFSTAMGCMTGESNDGGKTITYRQHLELSPMTGGPVDFRYVITVQSDDQHTMEHYVHPQGGAEVKAMELVYTRVKPAK